MNLTKNIDEMNNIEMNENTTTTALEIHQIVRTNRRYRAAPPDPISHISETASASVRRNSTLSSASATSTFQNTRDNNNSTPMMREDVARFVLPKPIFRPMLIKVEPIDEDNIEKITTPETSTTSPSASSGLASSDVVTVNSSIPSNSPPMVVINRANMNKTQSNDTWRSQETNKQLHQESSSDVHRFQAIKTSIEDPDKKEKRVYIKSKLKSDYLITTRAQKIKSATPQRVSSRSATKLSLSPTKKSKLNLKKTETNSIKSSRPRGRPRKKSKLDRS